MFILLIIHSFKILGYSPFSFGIPVENWSEMSEVVASLVKVFFANRFLGFLFLLFYFGNNNFIVFFVFVFFVFVSTL